MNTPQSARLPDGRLHLQHGPIDLIIEACGECAEVEAAYQQATASFQTVLSGLVNELSVLRTPLDAATRPVLHNVIAQRMLAAVWPHRARFITPMAAVAGAVADHMLAALTQQRELRKAYVNNGGDIALYLSPGEHFKTGLVSRVDQPAISGICTLHAAMPVRGIATSGWRGRSFSLGIADAVTVLAAHAAQADAAATLLGNAVVCEHPAIQRQPACALDPDSDLGTLPVVVEVGPLHDAAVARALDNGQKMATTLQQDGLINGAVLCLQGQYRVIGQDVVLLPTA